MKTDFLHSIYSDNFPYATYSRNANFRFEKWEGHWRQERNSRWIHDRYNHNIRCYAMLHYTRLHHTRLCCAVLCGTLYHTMLRNRTPRHAALYHIMPGYARIHSAMFIPLPGVFPESEERPREYLYIIPCWIIPDWIGCLPRTAREAGLFFKTGVIPQSLSTGL